MNDLRLPGLHARYLRHLLWLRSIALGFELLLLIGMYAVLQLAFPLGPALTIVTGLAIATAVSFVYLHRGGPVSEDLIFTQLVIDIAALAGFLFFTGGATNPFAPLFLLPVVVSAATLPAARTWLVAGLAATGYTMLMFFYLPLHLHGNSGSDFEFHIWGMWIGFLLAAVLVACFVSRIGATLRQHDEALVRAREESLHAEQVLALGTLAAGTAHELGTPLATIAVLAKEIEAVSGSRPEIVSDLQLLRGQIDHCKAILARMSMDAGQLQADSGRSMPVDQYINGVVSDWRTAHPQRAIAADCRGVSPAPGIVADRTLTQALVNVLDNAAEASGAPVEMTAQWDQEALRIVVRDRGPGMDPAIFDRIGREPVSTKPRDDGLGLGLFLACTTLDRLGGRIKFSNGSDRGNIAEILLPLSPLLAGGEA